MEYILLFLFVLKIKLQRFFCVCMKLLTGMTGVDLLLVITDTTEERNWCFVGCFMVAILHCYMDILPDFIFNAEEMLKKNIVQ